MKLVQASNDPDKILTTPTKLVTTNDEAKEVAMKVRTGLRLFPNLVGLAANQIGIDKSVCVVLMKVDTDCAHWLTMVNPHITSTSDTRVAEVEGCGSLREPEELYFEVTRPTQITVMFNDEQGGVHELGLTGFDARVVQHEIDHLDGILISDHGRPVNP